ncbi:MAG: hypothetical protein QM773_15110 [Hyphomonadaceae bacterium]
MAARLAFACLSSAFLGACGPPPPAAPVQQAEKPPQPAAPAAAPSEPLDPFVVMIGAERWGVIMDKALDGAREAVVPTAGVDESDMFRADRALKSGAARLIELRNQVCGQGLVTGDACVLKDWPAWTLEPPTDKTPIEEIQRRSDWLSGAMDPFTSAGCDAGRKATKDDLFCSVE